MCYGDGRDSYEADAVVDVRQEGKDREDVEERHFALEVDWKGQSKADDHADGHEEPTEELAPSVAHLGHDELTANVGEDDAHQEGEAARVPLQDVRGRGKDPDGREGEKEEGASQRPARLPERPILARPIPIAPEVTRRGLRLSEQAGGERTTHL